MIHTKNTAETNDFASKLGAAIADAARRRRADKLQMLAHKAMGAHAATGDARYREAANNACDQAARLAHNAGAH